MNSIQPVNLQPNTQPVSKRSAGEMVVLPLIANMVVVSDSRCVSLGDPPKALNANEQRITEALNTEYTLECVVLA